MIMIRGEGPARRRVPKPLSPSMVRQGNTGKAPMDQYLEMSVSLVAYFC